MENHGKSWKIGKKKHMGTIVQMGGPRHFRSVLSGPIPNQGHQSDFLRSSTFLYFLYILDVWNWSNLDPPKSCPQPFNHVQQFLPRLNPNSCRIRCVSTCENPYPAGLPHSPPVLSIILISQQVAALVPGLCSSHQQPRFVSHMWIHLERLPRWSNSEDR